jgi:hypothetical protein
VDPPSRPLVLKTLKDRYLRSERTRARFVHEARTWIRLMENATDDVNVVKAYRVERYYARPYIVMEFVGPKELFKNNFVL